MKLIKPSFEIWDQEEGLEGVYKQIEKAGRVCYKSEDKIAEGTAEAFTNRMVASGHGAILEHGTIYLYLPPESPVTGYKYRDNKFSEFVEIREAEEPSPILHRFITTNLRVLVENNWLYDLKYLCKPTEHHEKRVTVKFICDRGVSHEFVRHRVFSFAQESTRYCNYSKDKFEGGVSFIIPFFFDTGMGEYSNSLVFDEWKRMCEYSERAYMKLLEYGATPQQARTVLPNSLKTELVMTGTIAQWEGFFKLRDAGSAHPQAFELANPLHKEFIKRGYVAV